MDAPLGVDRARRRKLTQPAAVVHDDVPRRDGGARDVERDKAAGRVVGREARAARDRRRVELDLLGGGVGGVGSSESRHQSVAFV